MLMPPLSSADFVRGDANAPVVIVHYGDFECPYSGALHPVLRDLETRFGAQIAVAFRQFPLSELHPHAFQAALAAQVTGDKFWDFHDLLFQNQDALSENDLLETAGNLGFERAEFRAALESEANVQTIQNAIENAKKIGLHGTPSVFINGQFHDNDEGLWKMARLLPLVEAALPKS